MTSGDVNPTIVRSAAYAWRLLVIAAVVVGLVWLVGQLLVVVIPVLVAALLTRALSPVQSWLVRHRWRRGLAATCTLAGFLVVVAVLLAFTTRTIIGEFEDLGTTIDQALVDLEDWLVDDSPFDVSRADVQSWRDGAGEALSTFARSDRGAVASGVVLAGEVVIGILLALIVTFFLLKDGPRFTEMALGRAGRRRSAFEAASSRAWATLGGYLKGAALLGAVEAAAMGITLVAVGANLVIPVMVLTFLFAFVPIVGAITAGILATLVALATGGFTAAAIVAVVAIVVQQLDNDLLAPVIYGRSLQLHPLAVLLGIAAGGALFGIVGTVFAVPIIAVVVGVVDELRTHGRSPDGPTAGDLAT